MKSSYPANGHPLNVHNQSGIMGLAYNGLTSEYYDGDDFTVHQYSSIMNTLFTNDAIISDPSKRFFTLALSRDASMTGNGGVFTVGGLPGLTDPEINVSSEDYTSAELLPLEGFYSIALDSYVLDGTSYYAGEQVIIDSGANDFEVPGGTADLLNGLWSPPATPVSDGSGGIIYVVDCDATLTVSVGVTIGGTDYFITPSDLIGGSDGSCYSLINSPSAGLPPIIGDPLLRNVLAVFNWNSNVLS